MKKLIKHDKPAKMERVKDKFRVVCDVQHFDDGSVTLTILKDDIDDFHKAAQLQYDYNNKMRLN